jgi:hypothetical protein
MPGTRYSPLTRDELALLLAPGAEDLAQAWDHLMAGLHTLLSLRSTTYARPLVPEEFARERIAAALGVLDGTSFHAPGVLNARAVAEIERKFREHEAGPEVFRAVDDSIDTMLHEWDAIRYFPGLPPVPTNVREPAPRFEGRYAAGRL